MTTLRETSRGMVPAAPRRSGTRALLSGVFALVAFVGATVALLALLARLLEP